MLLKTNNKTLWSSIPETFILPFLGALMYRGIFLLYFSFIHVILFHIKYEKYRRQIMKKFKQITAIIIVVILIALYLTTCTLAIMGKKYDDFFQASLYATIVLPCMLYIIIWLRKVLSNRKE